MRKLGLLLAVTVAIAAQVVVAQKKAPSTLDIYFIDTEGGQATLLVTPAGETLLYDTGTGGANNRDADRITAIVKEVAVEQQLDHVIVSHYHGDHSGNAAELSRRFPIRHFWDHGGWTVEGQPNRRAAFDSYMTIRPTANVTVPKPGARLPMTGLEFTFVTSAGESITSPEIGRAHV